MLNTSKSGIYIIVNKINKKCYIGSTNNFCRRRSQHISNLTHNRHVNKHLQNAWNKYTKDAFVFSILYCCSAELLLHWEQSFINKYKPEYNIQLDVIAPKNMLGHKLSEETKKKIALAHLGKHHSEETKRKMSKPKKTKRIRIKPVKPHRTLSEANSGINNPMFGKHHSEETKRKMTEAKLGKLRGKYIKH